MKELDDNDLEQVQGGKTLAVAAAEGLGLATAAGVVITMSSMLGALLAGGRK